MNPRFIIYRLLAAAWFAAGLLHAQNPISVSKLAKDNTVKGPNLSALESGLPVDLLVESVLWSARQIKEGYAVTSVITKDGRVLSGFAHSEDKPCCASATSPPAKSLPSKPPKSSNVFVGEP